MWRKHFRIDPEIRLCVKRSPALQKPLQCELGVGTGEKRPVVRGNELAVATVMTVTLTCDHRVVDGATGARWLAAFKPLIEDPITMIV